MADYKFQGLEIPFSILSTNPLFDVDGYAGPYDTIQDAFDNVPISLRQVGRKAGIYVDSEKRSVKLYNWEKDENNNWVLLPQVNDYELTSAKIISALGYTPISISHAANGITANLIVNWNTAFTNNHVHTNKSVLDGITSTKISAWDSANNDRHTHSNKTVLDGITATLIANWSTAFTNSHTHSNKEILDATTASFTTALKTKLDNLGDSEGSVLTETVTTDLPLGNITTNQTLNEGLSFTEFVKLATTKVFYPTFVAPTYSITHNTGIREIGSVFNLTLTANFNRGRIDILNGNGETINQNSRSGLATKYTINGVDNSTNNILTINNYTLLSTQNFTTSVNYSVGPQPKDSKGNDFETPLAAGLLNANVTIPGYLRRFAGSLSSVPSNGTEIRNGLLDSSVLNTTNSFTINTGTVNKVFVIAIPSNKNLVSVKNTGTNENLVFALSSTITTVPDASDTNQNYKVYILENAIPFSVNYSLQITLS